MFNINYIKVPFVSAYDISTYLESLGFTVSISGNYIQAVWAADDFTKYQTGFINYYSGSGYWSQSGFSFSNNNYEYPIYSLYSTGFTSGNSQYLTGFTGYISYPLNKGSGIIYNYDDYSWQTHSRYATGNLITGSYFTGINHIKVYNQTYDSVTGNIYNFDNYEYQLLNNIPSTGFFTTGIINQMQLVIAYNQQNSNKTGQCYNLLPNMGNLGGYATYLNGGYAYPVSWPSPPSMPAYQSFAGMIFNSGYAQFPHNTGFLLNDFTVEFWFYKFGWLPGAYNRLIDKNNNLGFDVCRSNTTDKINFEILGTQITSNDAIQDQTWTPITCIRSGSNAYIYISGWQNVGPVTCSASQLTSTDAITFGMNQSTIPGAQAFSGYICEFRLWSYARASGDITTYYNKPFYQPSAMTLPSGLIVYLLFK